MREGCRECGCGGESFNRTCPWRGRPLMLDMMTPKEKRAVWAWGLTLAACTLGFLFLGLLELLKGKK